MNKETLFDQEANEANLKLNAEMNDGQMNSFAVGGGDKNSTASANMRIQEAHDGKNHQEEILPTYMTYNAPAIKVSGKSK